MMKDGWVCGALQAAILVGCAPADEEDFSLEEVLPQVLAAEPNICPEGDVRATPVAPNILFLLDKSSSMAGLDPRNHLRNRWTASADAVRTIAERFQGTASFGLITFPSTVVRDDGCSAGDVQVELGLAGGRFGINLGGEPLSWSATPTARTLDVAAAVLQPGCRNCSAGPRSVVLVTDGQPTCGPLDTVDPDAAAITETLAAVERLRNMGVSTYVVGFDIAMDLEVAATMNLLAQQGGTGHFYAAEDDATLIAALSQVVGSQHPCAFELALQDPGLHSLVVSIDDRWLPADAWRLEGSQIVLGNACPLLQDGRPHRVRVARACPVDTVVVI